MLQRSAWPEESIGSTVSSVPFLLVDAASLSPTDELEYLLSLDGAGGARVEQHVEIVDDEERGDANDGDHDNSHAVIGADQSCERHLGTLAAYRRMLGTTTTRSRAETDALVRMLGFCDLARAEHAQAVVTGTVLAATDADLARGVPRISPRGALALLGAFLRQQDPVPLGEARFHERTNAYSFTARVALSSADRWWGSVVHTTPSHAPGDIVSQAQAVLVRVARAIRARDAIHEALRCGKEAAGIEEALYHFDAFLVNIVAALDALARVAHRKYDLEGAAQQRTNTGWLFRVVSSAAPWLTRCFVPQQEPAAGIKSAGWQNNRWRRLLKRVAPEVAAVVKRQDVGAVVHLTVRMRNHMVHATLADEFLFIGPDGAEHRVMIPADAANEMHEQAKHLGGPAAFGLHMENPAHPWVDLAIYVEELLRRILGVLDALMAAMLMTPAFPAPPPPPDDPLHSRLLQRFALLAEIGSYPRLRVVGGLPASSEFERHINAIRADVARAHGGEVVRHGIRGRFVT